MTSKKPEWFEITEKGDTYAGIQKVNKKLPIITLVVAGAVILGGSIFATANNEPSAVAETPTVSQTVAAATSSSASTSSTSSSTSKNSHSLPTPTASAAKSGGGVKSLPQPTVTNVPQHGDGDGREHEERGEHREGERPEHDRD